MKMKIGALLIGVSLFAAHSMAATTQWRLLPSSKYDALCLTTIVANDPYTTQFYGPQREALLKMLAPDAVGAATRVNQAFKDAGVPVIGWLSLVYSASDAETLDAMIAATESPASLRAVLERTEYWYPERWAIYERIRPDLLVYLRQLKAAGYEEWWANGAKPEVQAVLAQLEPRLNKLDPVPLLEQVLRRPVDSEITVYTTRFCRPFGSRVLGSRFIMDVVGKKDPFRSVGAGALHEMTHPPFDRNDPRMASLVAKLENDPVIHGRWSQRPTSSGYNTFAGYIDEDVTRALDQIIGERVGVTFMDDAHARWREQEGGFHMAAAVFYHLMKEQSFLDAKESVADFLDRMHRERRLEPAVTARIVAQVEGKSGEPLPAAR